jgi:hypothetical protein
VRAWLFLPALSLGMTALLLAGSRAWGRGHALFNRVTLIEAMNGSRTGHEQQLLGIFSPTNRSFDLSSPDPGVQLVRLPSQDAGAAAASQAMIPTRQSEGGLQWSEVSFALWSLQQFKAERSVDLGGAVTLRLGAGLAGEVRSELPFRLERCRLEQGSLRCDLGTVAPGARIAIAATSWQRRGRPEEAGARAAAPGAAAGDSFEAIRDEVALMSHGNLPAGEAEAILTARVPDPTTGVGAAGLATENRASLLVVHVPVDADAASEGGNGRVSPSPLPHISTPASPLPPGRVLAPPSPGL